jgi:DNA-binding response OmpR family regulator
MSDDLLTLRMVVASPLHSIGDLWRRAGAFASIPIEVQAADAAKACVLCRTSSFDIVVLDAALSEPDREAVMMRAQAMQPKPLIALSWPPGAQRIKGADAAFSRPTNDEETLAAIERCIRMRLPKRLVIVDDSPAMRSVVRKMCSASRFSLEISEAENGVASLKELGAEIVLIDSGLPGFNGFETVSEIKRLAPRAAVVMMIAKDDQAARLRAQHAGAVAVLQKPFYPADVDVVLERIYEMD